MLGATLVVLLAGCARYHPAPIEPASSLESLEARRLDAPALGSYLRDRGILAEWPAPAWDLRLLTFAAFYYSPTMDVARATWAVAQSGMVTAGARANPTLSTGVGYNSTSDPDLVTPWILDIALSVPTGLPSRRSLRIREAGQRSESARLDVLTAAWQVRSRVRQAFVDLYVARASDSLLGLQRDLLERTVRILETQLAAGEVSSAEVTRVRIALGSGRLAVFDAAQRAALARSSLAEAIGVATATIDSTPLSFAALAMAPPPLAPNELRRQALTNRSDLRAALAEYEASQTALALEIRKQYPELSIGPGFQLDQGESKWTLSLSLPLALLDRNKGPIAEATARRQESAARFLELQASVMAQIDGAVATSRVAVAQFATADSLMRDLQRQERTALAAFQAGETSRLELLGAQSELASAGLARLDALAKAQLAIGALEDALQSPLDIEQFATAGPRREPTTVPPGPGGQS